MEFLITEYQLAKILKEQDESRMTSFMKDLYSFTKGMVNNVLKNYNINVRLLLTWGTSVGGLMLPLNEFIKTGNFDVTESQANLILCGIAASIFYENKKLFQKIYNKIKEEGIEEIFDIVFKKTETLKRVFIKFLNSIKVVTTGLLDIIAYTFLIPIITDIQSMTNSGNSIKEIAITIAERLLASGVVLVGTETLISILRKIIKRFK